MHPCLAFPEILHLICEQLRCEYPDCPSIYHPNRATLASLARTCRAWNEPALNSLWYHMDGVGTLFHYMLPNDLWALENGHTLPYQLQRPLKYSDITTLNKYSPYVRVFSEEEWPPVPFYRALSALCPNRLLPRLQVLDWNVVDPDAFPYLRLLLCPTMKKLDITFEPTVPVDDFGFLTSIPTLFSPHLFQLRLSFVNLAGTRITTAELLASLSYWKSISDLDVSGLPVDSLQSIIQLPNLRSVTIENEDDGRAGQPEPSASILQHSSIEKLSIKRLTSIGPLTRIFESWHLAKIRRLDLHFSKSSDHRVSLEGFISRIPLFSSTTSLEHLDLSIDADHTFTFSTLIIPLLQFKRLKQVSFKVQKLDGVTEAQLNQLATSWPLIESLTIASAHNAPMTLSSLVPLARECLNLRQLGLTIDASDPSASHELIARLEKAHGVQNESLQAFSLFRDSPIVDEENVTFLLSELFPNLSEVSPTLLHTWSRSGSTYWHKWERVEKMLAILGLAKVRERRRLESKSNTSE